MGAMPDYIMVSVMQPLPSFNYSLMPIGASMAFQMLPTHTSNFLVCTNEPHGPFPKERRDKEKKRGKREGGKCVW